MFVCNKTYAATYFRRFYLKKLLVDYDLNIIIPVCIYLAFKVCQYNFKLDVLLQYFPTLDHETIIKHEIYIINLINYDFYVMCPFKCLEGLLFKLVNL